MRPFSRETIIDRRQSHMRWSAVFAGTAFAIGIWILLQTLGMGIGLSAVDVDNAGNLKGIGIGTGVWSLIVPLIAMFIGALLAGRLSGAWSRGVGAMHGGVMWALALVIGLWAMFSLVSAIASGASRIGGAAVSTGAAAVSGAAGNIEPGKAMSALGIDANDLIAPINEKLAREGKPQITPEQLDNTLKAVAQRGVREGRLDRQVVVQEVARNTSLTGADAQDVANDIATRYEQAKSKVGGAVEQVGESAKSMALTAADRTGKALLFGGVMMLLSLGAGLLGGALGVRRRPTREDVPPTTIDETPRTTTVSREP
jgi:hypothetical protein